MDNLLLGAQYITEQDRELLAFCGERVTEDAIRTFAQSVTISETCLSCIASYPAPQVLRSCLLLAYAAMKSEDFEERDSYGFRIAVSSSSLHGGRVYLDADGRNILCAAACPENTEKWVICRLDPIVFSDRYLYMDFFNGAVLWACNEDHRTAAYGNHSVFFKEVD